MRSELLARYIVAGQSAYCDCRTPDTRDVPVACVHCRAALNATMNALAEGELLARDSGAAPDSDYLTTLLSEIETLCPLPD